MSITKISPNVVDFDAGITITESSSFGNGLILKNTSNTHGSVLLFNNDSSSPADGDYLGSVIFNGDDDGGNNLSFAKIFGRALDVTDGTEDGELLIELTVAGSSAEVIRFNSSEAVFNESSQDIDFRVESDGDANMLFVDGGNNRVGVGTSPDYRMHIFTADSGASAHANSDDLFIENSGNAGITIGSGTTSNGSIFFSDSDSSLSGQIEYRHNGDSLYFYTGGGSRLRVDSDGLKFGSDTATANALDDYEEGTWTPTIATGSITFSSARYTKVGRLIHISAQAQSPSDITTAAAVTIEGLPYPVHQSQAAGSVMGTYSDNTNATTVYVTDAEALYFYNLSNASWVTLRHDHFNSTSAYIYFQATYHTT